MSREMTHPGEVLMEEFMKPLGLSSNDLAQRLNVPANRISEIARGRRRVTAETALRLAKCFGTTPEFWMNLQLAYDVSVELHKSGDKIAKEVAPIERKAA